MSFVELGNSKGWCGLCGGYMIKQDRVWNCPSCNGFVYDERGEGDVPNKPCTKDDLDRWIIRNPELAPLATVPLYHNKLNYTDKPSTIKDSNPKDAIGASKVPMSTIPLPVLGEVGLGMLEGACKYGRHNYREIGVRSSVYFDATMRHMNAWYEGQDIDPDSGLSHITKAICSLVVLRDAMMNNKLYDDRPPQHANQKWVQEQNDMAAKIIAKYPNPKQPYIRSPKEFI